MFSEKLHHNNNINEVSMRPFTDYLHIHTYLHIRLDSTAEQVNTSTLTNNWLHRSSLSSRHLLYRADTKLFK